LEFKQPLCIVYGLNGSGKSGYVRLLKHICGSRKPGELLNNVFKNEAQPQSAKVAISRSTGEITLEWKGAPISELKGVDIYDTTNGHLYIDEENEVMYEPAILRLFTELTQTCEVINSILSSRINSLQSSTPQIPGELLVSETSQWYESLHPNISQEEVDAKTNWSENKENELYDLRKRLSDTNSARNAEICRRQIGMLNRFIALLRVIHANLSDEKCKEIIHARNTALTLRRVANEDAERVFSQSPITGVGTESWRLLWEAARKFSDGKAYPQRKFPFTGDDARCVLCQNVIDQETRLRLTAFEEFVKGELHRNANKAEAFATTMVNALPVIPPMDENQGGFEIMGITEATQIPIISAFLESLQQRKQACISVSSFEDLPCLPEKGTIELLSEIEENLEKKAKAYEEDATGQNRPVLEKALIELTAQKWIHQQKEQVEKEVQRLKEVGMLRAALSFTSTTALSKKKSTLAEIIITPAFVERFKTELTNLGASKINVELVKTKAQHGHVFHQIVLSNSIERKRTNDILSEGEFRIVSLAAFLADAEGSGASTPFIFDDPVSSLDQKYEEAVAIRLVQYSRKRQIIIFTHRLSLVGLLEKYAEKEKIECWPVCLSRYRVGDISDLPITLTKTKPTTNRFLSERLPILRKALQVGEREYETEAKALCRDIRILVEQVVENDLLNGIVKRYSPEVQTKNKIEHLAKITQEDCKFIDDMMTYYSRYEHSQSEEAPVELPSPEDFEHDLTALKLFIANIHI